MEKLQIRLVDGEEEKMLGDNNKDSLGIWRKN